MRKMLKGLLIFGTGVYTGVYIAQNYQDALEYVCKKTAQECDRALDKKKWLIDKVEDPKVLLEKAQAYIKAKLDEINDGKKGKD
ncbi:unnamed protein product [Euphydryas editha]|uniref:Uncharacterized protein n=1 Tax=Euphydryas editha TaxID=104508 RepID=A0AAU9UY78_EUPED|nr:unnamed protein product [Euphydryas editha]